MRVVLVCVKIKKEISMKAKRIFGILFVTVLVTLGWVGEKKVSAKVKATASISCPNGALHCADLSWSGPSGGGTPTGYNVYRTMTTGGCATVNPLPSGCTKVGSTNANTGQFTDSPLAASTTYFWVVTATNAAGESTPPAQVTATTTADPVPNPPTGLTVTAQ